MALSESISHRVHDLAQGVNELFVPFFLAGIGLSLDLKAFSDPTVLAMSLAALAVAVLTKLVGCGLPALPISWRSATQIGSGMVPRGEVGMVVAQIGASLGVISNKLYAVVVFMAVFTTIAAPPLLAWTYRGEPTVPGPQHLDLG